jgi:hypothetical protein
MVKMRTLRLSFIFSIIVSGENYIIGAQNFQNPLKRVRIFFFLKKVIMAIKRSVFICCIPKNVNVP